MTRRRDPLLDELARARDEERRAARQADGITRLETERAFGYTELLDAAWDRVGRARLWVEEVEWMLEEEAARARAERRERRRVETAARRRVPPRKSVPPRWPRRPPRPTSTATTPPLTRRR